MVRFIGMLVIFLCVIVSCVDAQTIMKPTGQFHIEVDVARFYGDSSQLYVEVYYDIHENNLTYKPDGDRYLGAANLQMVVRKDTHVVTKKEWTVPHLLQDTARLASGQRMVGLESIGLPEGDYSLTMSGYDLNDQTRKDSMTFPLQVRRYPTDHEALSDVEFCTSIQSSSNKQSLFYKNTLEVIPNAARLYGAGLPILYYYAEAYNLASNSNGKNVIIRTAVLDAGGNEVLAKDKSKSRMHNSSVEMGTMNISTLKSGTYVFRISLKDSANTVFASSAKKFFLYKPGSAVPDSSQSLASMDFSTSEFASMDDTTLNHEFAFAQYLSTQTEQQQFGQLTLVKAKQRFMYEFWLRRNSEGLTTGNEFRDEYFKRIQYANANYTVAFHQGWKTDRGRVYILYGACDEVERSSSSAESVPYEIWHYNSLQGGVIFAFVDRTGMGEFTLVHSTHRNELHDENWYQEYARKARE
jgi:GWxTD domain-containing protein